MATADFEFGHVTVVEIETGAFFAIINTAVLALSQWLLLWLGAKIFQARNRGFLRILCTCGVLCLIEAAVGAVGLMVYRAVLPAAGQPPGIGTALLGCLIFAAAGLVVLVAGGLCLKRLLGMSLARGVLTMLFVLVMAGVAVWVAAMAWLAGYVIFAGAQTFVIPTGAMAPALYGAHGEMTCNNCGCTYEVSLSERLMPGFRAPEPIAVACPNCGQPATVPVNFPLIKGDCILVERATAPKRWDPLVFKYPQDRSVSYVMRLVGLPGEQIEIAGGDLFVNERRLLKMPETAPEMWLPVHDSSFVPQNPLPESFHWKPAEESSAWKQDAVKWTFSGAEAKDDALIFQGTITDEFAYNRKEAYDAQSGGTPPLPVGDVMVECFIEEFSGDGSLSFRWEFRGQLVAATISAAGDANLAASGPEQGGREGPGRPVAAGQRLAFASRDGQAYLMQDGAVLALCPVGPQGLAGVKDLLKQPCGPCRLAIVARRCRLTLSKILVFKDVYYRDAQELGTDGTHGPAWGCAGQPAVLDRDSYFTLGDNSARSLDSRFWGAVPADALIGVARWRYWPPARWHEFRQSLDPSNSP